MMLHIIQHKISNLTDNFEQLLLKLWARPSWEMTYTNEYGNEAGTEYI